ncbi:MAG: TIGR03084 family protein [Pseudonocardiales bacterium]|nr:MAG: TIGR03084 family protein [Pseudonocardiales bacterium]
MADLPALVADLSAEGADLDGMVADLPAAYWARETPAAGWTIAHQIGHLAWTDDVAALAASDPERFQRVVQNALSTYDGYVDRAAAERGALPPTELLAGWRAGRTALATALVAVPEGTKLPWFGPPMSAASMATARLMESWAHGLDVSDTLGVTRTPTARLRHVAHIGVRTRDFAYLLNDRPVPAEQFRVELGAPDGELWTWGPENAAQRVTGPALDFCLLVTQRRNRAELALTAEGADADQWLGIAQAFAGAPGGGREPARAS